MGAKPKEKIKPLFHSLAIATFSAWKNGKRTPTNGMIEPLISYFGPRVEDITLLDCPHPGSDMIIPVIDEYKNNKLVSQRKLSPVFPPLFLLKRYNTLKTQPLFKIRDFISIFQVFLSKNHYDLFIGLESIHTLAATVLKKLGKVSKVVYYVSDYSPTRYESKIFNSFYLWLDRFCAQHADYIWDVSKAMMPARIKAGLDPKKTAPAMYVPNALFSTQIKDRPVENRDPYSIVFAGTIGPENGLDLAIEALYLARKKNPKLTLHTYGSGLKEDEEKVQKLITTLKLEKNVKNHGFISNLEELSEKLTHCMVGIAPYRSLSWSVRWYADATKLRLYFACGLPVITTQVPPLGKEAEEFGCAEVVKDTKEELANAIMTVFSHKKRYTDMRNAALQFAKNNTWENTYHNALKNMQLSF